MFRQCCRSAKSRPRFCRAKLVREDFTSAGTRENGVDIFRDTRKIRLMSGSKFFSLYSTLFLRFFPSNSKRASFILNSSTNATDFGKSAFSSAGIACHSEDIYCRRRSSMQHDTQTHRVYFLFDESQSQQVCLQTLHTDSIN